MVLSQTQRPPWHSSCGRFRDSVSLGAHCDATIRCACPLHRRFHSNGCSFSSHRSGLGPSPRAADGQMEELACLECLLQPSWLQGHSGSNTPCLVLETWYSVLVSCLAGAFCLSRLNRASRSLADGMLRHPRGRRPKGCRYMPRQGEARPD